MEANGGELGARCLKYCGHSRGHEIHAHVVAKDAHHLQSSTLPPPPSLTPSLYVDSPEALSRLSFESAASADTKDSLVEVNNQ